MRGSSLSTAVVFRGLYYYVRLWLIFGLFCTLLRVPMRNDSASERHRLNAGPITCLLNVALSQLQA